MREPEYEDDYLPARRPQAPSRRRRRGRGLLRALLFIIIGVLLAAALLVGGFAFFVLRNTPLGSSFGKSTYTSQQAQTLALSNVTQLIVKDQIGDVNVAVDPAATSGKLAIEKKVQAGSTSEASTEFGRIAVNVKPINKGDDPACLASTCLLITGTVPPTSGGVFGGSSDIANLTITLPSLPNTLTQPFALNASTGTGNLSATNFSGVLNLSGISGSVNISVEHALLLAGSCIQTLSGNVTVGNNTFLGLDQASDQVPCQNTTTQNPHPWFNIKSGTGTVDVTLPTQSTNVLLDANTNNGQITTDFGLNIPQASDGSATYHGPLVSNSSPTASLYLSVSTGNIHIHKI